MKYRIKVFPWKGKMLYMPQTKRGILSGWKDEFELGSRDDYSTVTLDIMASETSCLDWIKRDKDYRNIKQQKRAQIKKFENDNPVYYIKVDI